MARPAEKARAMLNKWVAMREAGNKEISGSSSGTRSKRRPALASECHFLADAERYRGQIIREIAQAVSQIQNPGLGEHAIRELNDSINQKLREKWHWNKRIYELGGLDFNAIEKRRQMEEAAAIGSVDDVGEGPQNTLYYNGYRYFGAAKNLPGVKEFLEKEAAQRKKVKRTDIYKNVAVDYFGWRDEDDGVLLELEGLATEQMISDYQQNSKRQRLEKSGQLMDPNHANAALEDYVDLPSQEEIAQSLLEHKKKALLARFAL